MLPLTPGKAATRPCLCCQDKTLLHAAETDPPGHLTTGVLRAAADAAGMEWHQGGRDQEAMQVAGTAGEAILPLSPSGAFPSPADYAALLHHDPAHTSQQVLLPDASGLSDQSLRLSGRDSRPAILGNTT